MRHQPDMSNTSAYYQDQPQIVAAYLADAQGHPAAPPPAHIPAETQLSSPRHSAANHEAVDFSSSERASVHTSTSRPYPSESWDSYSQSNRHSRQHSLKPVAQPVADSVAPVTSPYFEEHPILTPYSGGARKEDRTRGSWTDHSSYMSGDNRSRGGTRAQKRTNQDGDFVSEDGHDALMMLFRMSLPIPIFSLIASLYTVFGLFFTLLVSPLRLCSCIPCLKKTSFRTQVCDLLVPLLRVQERLIGSRKQSVSEDGDRLSVADYDEGYSIGGLIMVQLLSSFMSFGLLLLAWVAAFFWIFSMILGNPDGTERKDDGRAAVLGVCRWWQIWLGKARSPSG